MLDTNNLIGILLAAGLGLGFYFFKNHKEKFSNPFVSSGQTPYLSQYTVDFTEQAHSKKIDAVVGRDEEIRRLTQILARRGKNNAILIGEPGVGKTAIVEGFAVKIANGTVPEELIGKRVLALDVATLMSGTKYRGEFEERAKKIVKEIEVSNRSIILFVDEVHSVVQSQGSEGAINLSDILKPALARGDLQMIGATTTIEYDKYFKTDPSLDRRFQPIEVHAPSVAEALNVLKGVKEKYQEYHKVEFTDASLVTAVKLTDKLIKDRQLPDKAIDAIDEAAAMVKVANLNPAVNAVLYHAAVAKNPQVVEIWKKIQILDTKATGKDPASKVEREKLENELEEIGMAVVDSSDIEKIVKEWVV